MRNPWFARLMIILAVLIWGGYTILPTLMQESASERLANQALQAQGEEVETSTAEDDKRLPEAAHLPQQLRSIVLERTRNCRAACKAGQQDPTAAAASWVVHNASVYDDCIADERSEEE